MPQPGLMMDRPLLISDVIEHAAGQFGAVPIVSRGASGLFRYTYAECASRARRLANALRRAGIEPGHAVGTLAWNDHRHLEAYFAVSGSGLVIHTCNPRLHVDQLIYIVNHAEDRAMLFDRQFAPIVSAIAPHCPAVTAWICLTEPENMPPVEGVANLLCHEQWIAPHSDAFDWPRFDERTAAALCYTSGTTGHPKGVMYSHRSMVLNAMTVCMPGMFSVSPRDAILPAVPMFHVNGWCMPYAAPIGGAKLVLPGQYLDGASLYELIESEGVTASAGVPTIWHGVLRHLEETGRRFSTLERIIVGGSALPAALIARYTDDYGVEMRQGWGMTETVAVATMSCLGPPERDLPPEQRHAHVARQGKSAFGVEIKIIDSAGATLPRDGIAQGELLVRGQWIIESYYKVGSALIDGWFPTGDIATIDAHGIMQIRDRAKDLIKTGGEWISSIDLENAAAGHPAVAMAAVIGVRHPRWDERPVLFIVRKTAQALEREQILEFLAARVARWWLPDEVIFLDAMPVGGTGKVQKAVLRERYGGLFTSTGEPGP
jgi:fatty-acyl-CoA synthase